MAFRGLELKGLARNLQGLRSGLSTATPPSETSLMLRAPGGGLTRRAPQDLRLPCMVFAAVGSLNGAEEAAIESAKGQVKGAPGVLHVVRYRGAAIEGVAACDAGVAIVARGYWLARQSLLRMRELCALPAATQASQSDAEPTAASISGAAAACTAQWYKGHLRLWLSTSQPQRARAAAAELTGIAPESIDLRVLSEVDGVHGLAVLVPCLALARELQSSPVQVLVAAPLRRPQPPVSPEESLPSDTGVEVALAA